MNPGELFDIDVVERFGNPWHGLAHSTPGAGPYVDLPNGSTRSIPAWDGFGDSYVIAIPGQPAVTTSTADAADGMSWLNYGILYGRDKYLYGQPLGALRWIHIDADSLPWLAEAGWAADLLTVTLKRFGVFDGTPETYTYTSALVPRSDDLSISSVVSLRLDDVDSCGRQVVLTFKQSLSTFGESVRAVWLLTLSGSASAATLSLLQQADGPESVADAIHQGTNLDRYWFYDGSSTTVGPFEKQIDSSGNESYPGRPNGLWLYSAFARTNGKQIDSTIKRIIGGTLIGDVFALVKAVRHMEVDLVSAPDMNSLFNAPWWESNYPELGSGSALWGYFLREETYTLTGYYGIELGGILTKVDITEKWTTRPFYGDQEGWWAGYQHGVIVEQVKVDGVAAPSHYSSGGSAMYFNCGEPIYEVRIANRVYLSITKQTGFPAGFELLVSGPLGGQAIRQAPLSDDLTRGTSNPISGALLIDRQNPVAFI